MNKSGNFKQCIFTCLTTPDKAVFTEIKLELEQLTAIKGLSLMGNKMTIEYDTEQYTISALRDVIAACIDIKVAGWFERLRGFCETNKRDHTQASGDWSYLIQTLYFNMHGDF